MCCCNPVLSRMKNQRFTHALLVMLNLTNKNQMIATFVLIDIFADQCCQNIIKKRYSDSDAPNELEVFEQALFNTSKSFQYQNYQSFKEILEQWHTLKQVLDAHMGLDAPSYAAIDSSLEGIDVTLRKIYKADTFDTAPSQTSSTSDQNHNDVVALEQTNHPVAQPVSSQFQPVAQSHIENREQAIRLLQQISDYFQTNEPHSPVSYMLQKTIKWSQMPLHEWLAQVIKDEHPLQQIHDALGVQTQNEYE